MLKKTIIILWMTALCCASNARIINIPVVDERLTFATNLVKKLILSNSQYTLSQPYSTLKQVEHSRVLNDMRNKRIDLFLSMTSKEHEEEFQAIYIPVYRGLLGMRIPILKASDKELFRDVDNINDLRKFKAGQGRYWTDTQILQYNQLPVVTDIRYKNLFTMLNAGRFDYFPRAIHEPWREVTEKAKLNLTIDENILLWYPAPMYIFVRKNDKSLADHLNKEFEKIVINGDFKNMFYNDIHISNAIAKSNVSTRTVIRLELPYMSQNTPINRRELWVSPQEISNLTTLSKAN